MALFNCPECNTEISDRAYVCVNCGFPLRTLIGGPADHARGSAPEPDAASRKNLPKAVKRIRAMLFAGFLFMAVIAAVGGISGMYYSLEFLSIIDELYFKKLVALSATDDIALGAASLHMGAWKLASSENETDYNNTLGYIDEWKRFVDYGFVRLDSTLTHIDGTHNTVVGGFRTKAWNEYIQYMQAIESIEKITADPGHRGQLPAATQAAFETAGATGNTVTNTLRETIINNENLAKEEWDKSEIAYQRSRAIAITLLLANLIIGILLSWFLSQKISNLLIRQKKEGFSEH